MWLPLSTADVGGLGSEVAAEMQGQSL